MGGSIVRWEIEKHFNLQFRMDNHIEYLKYKRFEQDVQHEPKVYTI